MKLEDQVASLEDARKLQAAGFPQDTAFVWTHAGAAMFREDDYIGPDDIACAAPTVAEMLAWLPPSAQIADMVVRVKGAGSVDLLWDFWQAQDENGYDYEFLSMDMHEILPALLLWLVRDGKLDPKTLAES